MNINVLSAWKQEKILEEKEKDYLKRLTSDVKISIREIKGEKGEDAAALKKEGEKLLSRIERDSFTVVLSEKGKLFDSPGFSRWIEKMASGGTRDMTFVVGSSSGIDTALVERSDMLLSLSPMTLPHQMARVILIEQIYRAFSIMKGRPYHK